MLDEPPKAPVSTTTRDSLIIGSILIAAFALSIGGICIITTLRKRRSAATKHEARKRSMAGTRDEEDSMTEHLRKQSTSGRSSVIELDEIAVYPNVLTPRTSRDVAGVFEFTRAAGAKSNGPLDSHPPTPTLEFPPAVARNAWRAPEEWAVPMSRVEVVRTIGVLPDAIESVEALRGAAHTEEDKTKEMGLKEIGIAK